MSDNHRLLTGKLLHLPFFTGLCVLLAYAVTVASTLELQSWDEARNVLNAWEMQKNGDWLQVTYQGQPDHWNIKPPLGTWLIAACIKLFGFSELAVRLPSLFFGTLTLLLVYGFLFRETRNILFSSLGAWLLGTSVAFFGQHCFTTADYDAILIFFTTLAFVSVFNIFFRSDKRWFLPLGIALASGFMIKSLAGLTPIAFAGIAAAITRNREMIRSFHWIKYTVFPFLLFPGIFLLLREVWYKDDFLLLFFKTDVLNRITSAVEGHAGEWEFYIHNMNYRFEEGQKIFLAGLILFAGTMFFRRSLLPRPLSGSLFYVLLCPVAWLVIFSVPQTKISWYALPAYPLMLIFPLLAAYAVKPFRFWNVTVVLLLTVAMGYQVRRLYTHVETWRSRDYEFISKYLLVPNKNELKDQKVISVGEMMPSAVTYLEIFSGGNHQNFNKFGDLKAAGTVRNTWVVVGDASLTGHPVNYPVVYRAGYAAILLCCD